MSKQRKFGAILLLLGLSIAFVYAILLIISFLVFLVPPFYIQTIRLIYLSFLILAIIVLSSVKLEKPPEETIDEKSRKFMKGFLITLSILITLGIGWLFVPNLPLSLELDTTIACVFLIVFTLFLMLAVPHVADKLVSDHKGGKFIVFGLHIHENFMGMFFIVNGIIFIIFSYNLFDIIAGILFLSMGAFLIGRDAEDVRNFKIIQRVKNEEDE